MSELRNQALIKSINRAKILNAIRLHTPIARAQIADMTGLDRKSLTNFISELIQEGLVIERGKLPQKAKGRPFTMLEFKKHLVMGLEISSGSVNGLMLDLYGNIHSSHHIDDERIDNSPELLVKALQSVYKELKSGSAQCLGVGLAVQGVVDSATGLVLEAVNVPSAKINLKDALANFIKEDVSIEGSSCAGAIAEKWFGAGASCNDFIYVELGTGIGAGIISSRRLYTGAAMHAGELGHIIIERNGDTCRCGNRGCLEAYASETRILKEAGRLLGRRIQTIEEMASSLDNPSLAIFLEETARRIGFGIANIVNLLNPKVILLGGHIIELLQGRMLEPIRQGAAEAALDTCMKDAKILASSIKSPVVKGAAALPLSKIFEVEGHFYI